MNLHLCLGIVAVSLGLGAAARAQELTDVLIDGNYSVLGGETIAATAPITAGYAPINDDVAFVYDPELHFFMRGYYTDPAYDRRDAYRDVQRVDGAASLPIYDDELTFGRGNYLLTGDGPEHTATLDLGAPGAAP